MRFATMAISPNITGITTVSAPQRSTGLIPQHQVDLINASSTTPYENRGGLLSGLRRFAANRQTNSNSNGSTVMGNVQSGVNEFLGGIELPTVQTSNELYMSNKTWLFLGGIILVAILFLKKRK
jgi:hypothetical protein